MSWQILALIVVVVGFSLLLGWAFWPGNKRRFEQLSRIPLDSDPEERKR